MKEILSFIYDEYGIDAVIEFLKKTNKTNQTSYNWKEIEINPNK
jgi:hypothetical protein